MSTSSFAADLQLYGPHAPQPGPPLTPRQGRAYCRRLARRHYENFTVASWLLPRSLRQHVCNIYAYCRWADDLADETVGPQQSLALLRWWEQQIQPCYAGKATHPVFLALRETIREFNIPPEPFFDLLVAFRQDQRVRRYETLGEVLNYCRYSANPVGRLVLHLGRCCDADRTYLSDCICTGLQLANFCQDVARDWDRGWLYLPQADCRRFAVTEAQLVARKCTPQLQQLLAAMVGEAEAQLRRGLPLATRMPEPLQLSVALFAHGGLAILDAIRRQQYDVWTARPTLSRWSKLKLAARCWWRLWQGTLLAEK